MSDSETGRRTCRACGEPYAYPGYKSQATRLHCEQCVKIPEETRRAFEQMRRRIDRLTKEVEALKREQG